MMSNNMQGIRGSARLGPIQPLKHLGCRVGIRMCPLRANLTSTESCEVKYLVGSPQLGRPFSVLPHATRLVHSFSVGIFNPCESQLSDSKTLKRWLSVFRANSALSGIHVGRGCPISFTSRLNHGLGWPTQVVSAPRVASVQADKALIERRKKESLCPGCGIRMQNADPQAPGFFQHPTKARTTELEQEEQEQAAEEEDDGDEELTTNAVANFEMDMSGDSGLEGEGEGIWHREQLFSDPVFDLRDEIDPAETRRARRGFGKRSAARKSGEDSIVSSGAEKPTVCARCHSLRNYGKVKDESVENLLPDFDFEHVVGSRLKKSIGRRAVVLMVIDSVDFDGSFPRAVANLLANVERDLGSSWREGKAGNVPRLLIVLNKVDLLPSQISPIRLEQWVRRRSRAGGVTQTSGVHIVSAFKGWGVDKLSKQIIEMAGPRGDVWVIGAQNVGKSSLINALGKLAPAGEEGKKNVLLTEAAVPGTTVGVLELEGILPGKARLLDTPGLLHPHQITTRLTKEEQKMVQIRKVLKPRTFRVKVGHALSLGGLVRLTIEKAPADSIYATIWASSFISCHMGKAETAQDTFDKHIGEKLQPPSSKERVVELGLWLARTLQVTGDRWDRSSVDVSVAGLGWIALALSGSATLKVWTYEGVAVSVRESIALDLAPVFERPGFTAMMGSGKGKG